MKRRILQEIQLDKIAAVDFPCQEHARVTILKRAPHRNDSDRLRRKLLMAKIAVLQSRISKIGWTDEARQASIEARRANAAGRRKEKGGGKGGHPFDPKDAAALENYLQGAGGATHNVGGKQVYIRSKASFHGKPGEGGAQRRAGGKEVYVRSKASFGKK